MAESGLDLDGSAAISSNSFDLGAMLVLDGVFLAHERRGSLGVATFGSSMGDKPGVAAATNGDGRRR